MKLSTRSRYGTRLMIELAKHYGEGPIQTGEIARCQGVSVKYLEQLLIPLKRADFVRSVRGPKGGHMLARPPREISVGDIVRVLERQLDLAECLGRPETCFKAPECPTRKVWEAASQALMKTLDSIPLSNLLKQDGGWTKDDTPAP